MGLVVAVGVTVAVGLALGVALGVTVAAGLGLSVALGVTVAVGPTTLAVFRVSTSFGLPPKLLAIIRRLLAIMPI